MKLDKMLSPLMPYFLALLRVVSGLLFLEHGTQKILHFPVSDFHPPIFSLLGVAGLMEIVGGVLIILGLFTRPAAFILSGQMAFAYFMMHAPNSFFPALNGGDAAILFCFLFLFFVFSGPGAFALDNKKK
ncbi:DoxX family protein [Martelella alba]|uniref:DoxX family protein n=1 Tax=Martelella alba TaxID=2590451 RepID=A0A506UCA0_9HYPH|nr:DoxX family protein [Martelella alba]TPW30594.1 DoxX family protein [Martelella alba]